MSAAIGLIKFKKTGHIYYGCYDRYGKLCEYYEPSSFGGGYCEALLTNGNPTVICKGNRHNCCKVKYSEMARKNDKQYNDYWKHEESKEKT